MSYASSLKAILSEDSKPANWRADYYCITPSGSKARFTRAGGTYQLEAGEASEWTVLAALRKAHPGCQINILSVKFSG
jgi:hypothetical protein